MIIPAINKDSLDFLKDLSENNNRDWFNEHKDRYTKAYENLTAFADALIGEMNKHDRIETPSGKKSLFRIYRDVRFSKDKTPYNTHWNGRMKRATKKLRGGYYYRFEPSNSILAGGFFGPVPDDMKRIRQDIGSNYEDWQKILSEPTFINTFGKLRGHKVLGAPRGYAKDHPAISLLRHKQFLLIHELTDEEVCAPDLLYKANDVFKKMRPFFDHMSEVLTTDANGIPLI